MAGKYPSDKWWFKILEWFSKYKATRWICVLVYIISLWKAQGYKL